MSLDDLVNITISRETASVSRAGFGYGLILGKHAKTINRVDGEVAGDLLAEDVDLDAGHEAGNDLADLQFAQVLPLIAQIEHAAHHLRCLVQSQQDAAGNILHLKEAATIMPFVDPQSSVMQSKIHKVVDEQIQP